MVDRAEGFEDADRLEVDRPEERAVGLEELRLEDFAEGFDEDDERFELDEARADGFEEDDFRVEDDEERADGRDDDLLEVDARADGFDDDRLEAEERADGFDDEDFFDDEDEDLLADDDRADGFDDDLPEDDFAEGLREDDEDDADEAFAAGFEEDDFRVPEDFPLAADGLLEDDLAEDDFGVDAALPRLDADRPDEALVRVVDDDDRVFAFDGDFASPASARSLFTVRAAISSARPFWPRFS